jgi:hypothetical protein
VATTIFFESNGGQAKAEATVPEIRFAVAEPGLDIGNVETALEALTDSCYYLAVERNRYHFSLKENLNKRFADRRATIQPAEVEEHIRAEIQELFPAGAGAERVFFPEKTIQLADRPCLMAVVLPPEQSLQDEKVTTAFVEKMTREYGTSSRTFKSAIVFCVPESPDLLREDARKELAWEAIKDDDLNLDETQIHQLAENLKRARRDLKETIWPGHIERGHQPYFIHHHATEFRRSDRDQGNQPGVSDSQLAASVQGMADQRGARCLLCLATIPATHQPGRPQGNHIARRRQRPTCLCRQNRIGRIQAL